MKMNLVLFAFLGIALSANALSPTVVQDSVSFKKHSPNKVVIAYELENEPAIVTLDILTNGVSIGEDKLTELLGDVNKLVETSQGSITWIPGAGEKNLTNVAAVVTARPVSVPPDYLVVDLRSGEHSYYVSSNAVPGGVTADVYKTDKLVMRRIPARGVPWRMGSPSDETGHESRAGSGTEMPRMVTLSEDYYIAIYPLTVRQQKNISDESYRTAEPLSVTENDRMPADCSYSDMRGSPTAIAFDWPRDGHQVNGVAICGRLRNPDYVGIDFDLPTSAQWEFACRAGTTGPTYYDGALTNIAWTSDNANGTKHPVGLLIPNAFGLYDMLGNKMEFVLDNRPTGAISDGSPALDPLGPTEHRSDNHRILRGGSFAYGASDSRSAWAYGTGYGTSDQYRGARLMCPVSLKFD